MNAPQRLIFADFAGLYTVSDCVFTFINDQQKTKDYYCSIHDLSVTKVADKDFVISMVDELSKPFELPHLTQYENQKDDHDNKAEFLGSDGLASWASTSNSNDGLSSMNEGWQ